MYCHNQKIRQDKDKVMENPSFFWLSNKTLQEHCFNYGVHIKFKKMIIIF